MTRIRVPSHRRVRPPTIFLRNRHSERHIVVEQTHLFQIWHRGSSKDTGPIILAERDVVAVPRVFQAGT
jgi:hypothetical protein